MGARFGADFRLGLGTAFTLDATVNPDFGQVEADPAVINLTAVETFFQERRPFFVEDAQVFDFGLLGGQQNLFYSRRIGRSPQGNAPDDADFVDITQAATIMGAAKLTGRTEGGLSLGALGAVTQAEEGDAYYRTARARASFPVEPRTEYGVLKVQQDLNGGASQVGGLFTALHRGLPGDGALDALPDQAYSAGVRFEHQWSNRAWRLDGLLAGSHVRGSPEAMTRIQRASSHYFQRPDATRQSVDSMATSLTGAYWLLRLNSQNREHWTWAAWLSEVTQGFEINDLGFSPTRERLHAGSRIGYREIRPGRIFRDYSVNLLSYNSFSHEALDDAGSWSSWRRAHVTGTLQLRSSFTFLNLQSANLDLLLRPELHSRSATRGGPVMVEPRRLSVGFGFNTDPRQRISFNAGLNVTRGSQDSGNELTIDGGANLRLSSAFQVVVEPRFSIQSDAAQYVTSTRRQGYQPTFGTRYLFGEIERKTLSLEARVDYIFSPTLSFQLYTQPLLSSGDYVRYKQLARGRAPSSSSASRKGATRKRSIARSCLGGTIRKDEEGTQHIDLDGDGSTDLSFLDRDFNVRSLIGNAVLRWEYRPGSTIFLVWQRRQQGEVMVGDFDFGRDLDALWGLPAENTFIVKVNYWLGL